MTEKYCYLPEGHYISLQGGVQDQSLGIQKSKILVRMRLFWLGALMAMGRSSLSANTVRGPLDRAGSGHRMRGSPWMRARRGRSSIASKIYSQTTGKTPTSTLAAMIGGPIDFLWPRATLIPLASTGRMMTEIAGRG